MIGFSISTARSWERVLSLPYGVASVGIGSRKHEPQRSTRGIALRGIAYVPFVTNTVEKIVTRPFGITNAKRFTRIDSRPKGIATEGINK